MSLYCSYPRKYSKIIEKCAFEYEVSESLIYAVIRCESGFKQDAISHKGAVGLMQIMPNTAKWVMESNNIDGSVDKLTNPDFNIKIGTLYLKYLLDKYENNLIETLAAYNAGEGNIDRLKRKIIAKYGNNAVKLSIEDIEYDETKNYVKKVLKSQSNYEKLYNLE